MSKKFWPVYVVAVCTWSLLSYASLVEWLVQNRMFARVIAGRVHVSDFVNSYNAGKLALQAMKEPTSIYDAKVQDASSRELIAPIVAEQPFYLQYPPYFFVFMIPLCIFNITGAWIAWFAVYAAITWFCLRYLTSGIESKIERNVAIALVFASFPAWVSFELGQTSLPEFAFFTAFLWALQHARPWLAGVVAALMTLKLQYTPYIGLTGLILGRWKFLGGGLIAMLAMLGASVLLLGPANVMVYPQALLHGETGSDVSGVAAAEMQNLRGWLCLLLGGDSNIVHIIALAGMVLACVVIAFVWLRAGSKATEPELFRTLASVTVLAAITTSIHTHTQDYLMAAIPCIWLWQLPEVRNNERSYLRKLIIWFPAFSWIALILKPGFMLARIQPLFFWAVAMLVFTVPVAMARIRADQHSAQS